MEIIEKFYIKKSRRKNSLWKCIRVFFCISNQPFIPNFPYTSSLPMRRIYLPMKENSPAAERARLLTKTGAPRAEERHLLPSPLLSPTSWLSSFCNLLLSYFSCLYSDSLLHLACSMSGPSLHFVLAPWISSYCLFPTFSSVCDSAGQDKSSPCLFLKMNHPGEKAVGW